MDNQKHFRPRGEVDEDLQRELDAALGGMSLEDIVAAEETASRARRGGPARGARRGRVVAIHGDDIFVDVGLRSEGLLPSSQFRTEEPLPKEGDEIEVIVDGYDEDEGMVHLRREGAVEAATWDTIERGQMVEGRVTGHNKGGLEVTFGGIEAFMPISQIELHRVEDLAPYVQQRLMCVVTDIDYARQSVIVSRRDLLKQEAAKKAEELWDTLHEGKIVPGRVRSIMPYGAFVDIGGADGLLHVKDMAHGRVEKPEDIVHVGQEIEVRVLSFDREERKIALGLKQIQPDPWEGAEGKWTPGTSVTGRITRLADFGVFLEIEPGVEGLIPISELSFRRIGHPREVVHAGDVVRVAVMKVDEQKKRISLSLKQAGDDPWQGASARWPRGNVVEGVVTRTTDFGAFVELGAGVEGLVHISELDAKRVPNVESVVKPGQNVRVKVLEVDEERRRISLSLKQAAEPSHRMPESSPADASERDKTSHKPKKHLKGGLDAGSAKTAFGELRLG